MMTLTFFVMLGMAMSCYGYITNSKPWHENLAHAFLASVAMVCAVVIVLRGWS